MQPQVVAAIVAASVGVLTLVGTVVTQIIGFRSTRANTEQQIKATHKDTADTLTQQRELLDRTLAEQRTRTLNERFVTAAGQLAGDQPPTVQVAGVYAMAGLADDWEESRQTCVDVLCAHLRMPYESDPGKKATDPQRRAFQASREVRHTVIRVITAHLKDDASVSWERLDYDFTGVVFDGGDFRGANFSGGNVNFASAQFSGGEVYFGRANFSGAKVYFDRATFSRSKVDFTGAQFSGGEVHFAFAEFSGGQVDFPYAEFSGSEIYFSGAKFSGAAVGFDTAKFSGSKVHFLGAQFSGGTVGFGLAKFSGGTVDFDTARFSGGRVDFSYAKFSGGTVSFTSTTNFSGGQVDFRNPGDWSYPPKRPRTWTGTPPQGVMLPEKEDHSQT